jgi:hypothetical protein
MSKVHLQNRPIVAFDASKKEHRRIFYEAMKYRTWGRAPIRFWLEEDNYNLIDQIQKKMAKYYMAKEFGSLYIEEPLREGEVRIRPNPYYIDTKNVT